MKVDKKCPRCRRYLNNRIVTADAIIIRGEKVLLIKRNNEPFRNYYALPGGIVNIHDTIKDTVVKETKEETGLDVKIDSFIGFYDNPKRDLSERHSVTFVYSVQIIGGRLKSGDDAKEAKWFDLDKLPKLAFDHKKMIEDYEI